MDWTEFPFDEVIDFREGPGILAKDFRDAGVPLIRLAGLGKGVPVLAGCNYLDPDIVKKKWGHFRVSEGDILLSTSASLGRIAVVDAKSAGAIPYTGIIRMRPNDDRLLASYIQYLLESPHFQRQVEAMGVGSVLRHFGPTHLRQMSVIVPPLPEQRAIAHILGSLDDKIELNRRMNAALEAIARALFKSWFVDFDPVHARRGERESTLPPEVLALFPADFEESELGPIPAGWEIRPLDKIAHYQNGLAWKRYAAEEDAKAYLSVIKIREMRMDGFDEKSDRTVIDIKPSCKVYDGDVLFSWSGSLLVDIWSGGEGALNQHLFKVTSKKYPKWFYYHWTKEYLERFQRIAAAKATTMGHIRRRDLKAAKVLIPPKPLLHAMGEMMEPLLEKLINNRLESRTLAELRDTLLPRLISGELRVPENLGQD